jgi:hypothetical protein
MKRTILTTAALAAVLFIGAGAQAADNTFSYAGVNHNWSTAANWSGGVPTAADNAVIPAGEICDVDTNAAVADTVEVYGTLNILTGNKKLTLDGAGTSHVSGTGRIYLDDSGSELSFTSNNHTISYKGSPGEIVGLNDSSKISVDEPSAVITLTNNISISGSLRIEANSEIFDNDGTVKADRGNGTGDETLTCYSGTYTGTGTYKVCASGSTLKFDSNITAATGLGTDFEVSNGTLDIDEPVTTTGDVFLTGGTIDVANVTFSFNQ